MDNDGDLDMIGQAVNGPVVALVNNSQNPNRIAFELRDEIGNHFGVGSVVIVRYGTGRARQQMREIQASGGFLSFDAPLAHFGLGEYDEIAEIEIHWSTGTTTLLRGPFSAGARYVISRPRARVAESG